MYSNLYVVKCPKFDHLITPLVWSSVQMGGGRSDQKISVCFIHRNWLRYRLVSSVLPRCYGFRDHGTAGERRTCRGGLGVDARWFVPAAVRKTLMRKMRTNWTVRLISPYVPYVYGFTIIHIVSLLVNHMCICFLCFPWPCLRREQNPSTQEQDALLPDDEELLQSKMERARRYQRNLST